MTKGRVVTIALGLGLLCGATALLLLRASPPSPEAPPGRARAKTSDRVRERLKLLRGEQPDGAEAPNAPPATDLTHHGNRIETHDGLASDPRGAAAPPVDEPDDDLPSIKKIALEDPDPDRRLAAITMLATTDDPEAPAILAQALSDRNEEVRLAALEALSDFTSEPPVDAIEDALRDPSPDIRFEALSVLADIGGERAHNAVERALNDPDEDVRALAEGILELESPTATAAEHPHPSK